MKDQPELMLQTLSKKSIIWILTIASLFFIVCVIIASLLAPSMIQSKTENFGLCKPTQTFNCISDNLQQEFLVKVKKVKKENNYIYFQLISKMIENRKVNVRMNFTITDNKENDVIVDEDEEYELKDDKSVITYLISHIEKEDSSFNIRLKLFESVKDKLLKLTFKISFINKDFFIYLLSTKYVFFSYMLTWLVIFAIKTHKMTFRYLPFETKTSLIMCISVLIFNEPLIGGYPEFSEIGAISVSVFCNVQFICSLVLYWLFMLKKINNPYCQKVITLVEFIFICSLFALLFVVYVYVQSNLKYDTKYNWEKDLKGARKIIYKVIISILVLFAFWMLVLMLMSLRKWRDNSFTSREKVYWAFNYALIIVSFVFIGLGYIQKMEYGQILLIIVALYNIFFSVLLLVSTPELKSFQNWIRDVSPENSIANELESQDYSE